ncbi:hypothetical protein MSG28_012441 [Choristoneura fumiferana]|uniref:Uncharacterized protein n=1 Tax=Choristoneura fumiferana TaxID=7141 RepID=A0ACC0KD61_CHOFU|nr:hypothetical protein MSG28_012441 [Choristoneura fumiferana]
MNFLAQAAAGAAGIPMQQILHTVQRGSPQIASRQPTARVLPEQIETIREEEAEPSSYSPVESQGLDTENPPVYSEMPDNTAEPLQSHTHGYNGDMKGRHINSGDEDDLDISTRGTWSSGEASPGLSDEECCGGGAGETPPRCWRGCARSAGADCTPNTRTFARAPCPAPSTTPSEYTAWLGQGTYRPIYVPLLGTGLLSEQEGLGHSFLAGPVRIGNFAL